MRTAFVLAVALFCAPLRATTVSWLAPGFSATTLGPTLPGGSDTNAITAIDTGGNIWMSNGFTLYRLDGEGGVEHSESVWSADGGPNTRSASHDLVFDSAGAMYINDPTAGKIFKRSVGGDWTVFASVPQPLEMRFDSGHNLIVLGNHAGTFDSLGTVYRIDQSGIASVIGQSQGETFTFDAGGNLIIPHYIGTGIDMMTPDGVLTTLFEYDRPAPILFESIERTSGGNYIVGVNTSFDFELNINTSKLIRINGATGEQEVIGINVGNAIPVDLTFHDENLIISGFGSLKPLGVTGDFDGSLTAVVPTPSSFAAGVVCMGLMALRRNRRDRSI